MQGKKTYIVLIVVLFVFSIVMFCVFGLQNFLQKDRTATIIVGDNTVWKYHDRQWENMEINHEIEELNWKKYHIFLDHEDKGAYSLWFSEDKWYAFDDERNSYPLEGLLLAYDANYDLKASGFQEEEIVNRSYVASVLEKYNLDLSSRFTVSSKISFDIDQDGETEEFYVISNAFALDFEPKTIFSFAFMVKNQSIYMIYENVGETSYYNACKPFFHSFVDVDADNQYEFILSCGYYSMEEQLNTLYQFSKSGFEVLVSNN